MYRMNVIENGAISHKTKAITEFHHPELRTKIYDQNGIFYSRKSMRQLLEEACIHYCTSYHGRLAAVRKAFRYSKKTPLIISPEEMLCAIPTASPDNMECQWIFMAHIEKYIVQGGQLVVKFKDETELKLNCSRYIFTQQFERAAACLFYFGHLRLLGPRRDKAGFTLDRWWE
jgi:competence protein ComK